MKKRFFYDFNGTILIEANDQAEAEELVTGIPLDDFLINERIFETDKNYVAYDLKIREEQLGTYFQPINDPKEFE